MMVCKRCDDSGWACEEHPGRPWAGLHACIVAQREGLAHSATSPKMDRIRECRKVSRPASTRAGAISDWSAEFEDPIELPNGRKLLMLRDAATYITKLPKAEHITPEWQAAMEAPILVAENFGPMMLPCLVALKALNRHRLECSIGDCCPWVVARVDRSLHVLLNFSVDSRGAGPPIEVRMENRPPLSRHFTGCVCDAIIQMGAEDDGYLEDMSDQDIAGFRARAEERRPLAGRSIKVAHHDAAHSQQVLDIPEAEGKPGIEPDGLLNNHGRS
jgi:hypothetical protein